MSKAKEAIRELQDGRHVFFYLGGLSWEEGRSLIDKIEMLVGKPLERREILDERGRITVCWVDELAIEPPIVTRYKGVTDESAD